MSWVMHAAHAVGLNFGSALGLQVLMLVLGGLVVWIQDWERKNGTDKEDSLMNIQQKRAQRN
jgi:hypothetical protein